MPNANYVHRKNACTRNGAPAFRSPVAIVLFATIMIVSVRLSCGLIDAQAEKEKHGKWTSDQNSLRLYEYMFVIVERMNVYAGKVWLCVWVYNNKWIELYLEWEDIRIWTTVEAKPSDGCSIFIYCIWSTKKYLDFLWPGSVCVKEGEKKRDRASNYTAPCFHWMHITVGI